MERLKEGMLQLTKGWDRAQVERLVEDVILDVIDPYVYAEALDLMELHRSEGRRIYIVSSSPEEVVRPLARHFGVSGVIATRAEVGADGRYTGELQFYAYGEGKAEAVRAVAQADGDRPVALLRLQRLLDGPAAPGSRREPRRRESGQGAQEGRGGTRVADPRFPSAGPVAHPDRLGGRSEGERRGRPSRRPASRRCSSGSSSVRAPPAAAPHPPREVPELSLVLGVLAAACDGSSAQAPPPLDPPPVESSQGGGACSQTEIDGTSVSRFEAGGSCLPGDVMVLYRCSPSVAPVLRDLLRHRPRPLPGWGVRRAGGDVAGERARRGGERRRRRLGRRSASRPRSSASEDPPAEDGPEPRTEPLVYVRSGGVTERWLRLDGPPGAGRPTERVVDRRLDPRRRSRCGGGGARRLERDARRRGGTAVLLGDRARGRRRRAGRRRRRDGARHQRLLQRTRSATTSSRRSTPSRPSRS